MEILLIYVIVSVIYESIATASAYRKFVKKIATNENFTMIKMVYEQTLSSSLRTLINPYTIFIASILFVVICPFLMPYSLFRLFKKAIGYKSKSDIEAEIRLANMEKAQKASKEWLEKEGCPIDNSQFKIDIQDLKK